MNKSEIYHKHLESSGLVEVDNNIIAQIWLVSCCPETNHKQGLLVCKTSSDELSETYTFDGVRFSDYGEFIET